MEQYLATINNEGLYYSSATYYTVLVRDNNVIGLFNKSKATSPHKLYSFTSKVTMFQAIKDSGFSIDGMYEDVEINMDEANWESASITALQEIVNDTTLELEEKEPYIEQLNLLFRLENETSLRADLIKYLIETAG